MPGRGKEAGPRGATEGHERGGGEAGAGPGCGPSLMRGPSTASRQAEALVAAGGRRSGGNTAPAGWVGWWSGGVGPKGVVEALEPGPRDQALGRRAAHHAVGVVAAERDTSHG